MEILPGSEKSISGMLDAFENWKAIRTFKEELGSSLRDSIADAGKMWETLIEDKMERDALDW